MKHDHLMGWPAALLCIDEPERKVGIKPTSKPVPWAWVEFEKGNFDMQAPKKEKVSAPADEIQFNLGDEVMVTGEQEWLAVGAFGVVEEISSYRTKTYCRVSVHESQSINIGGFKAELGKQLGFTVSWWIHKDCLRQAGDAFPSA